MRRLFENALLLAAWAAVMLICLLLGGLLGFLLWQSLPALNSSLLFGETPAWQAVWGLAPVWDGLWPAVVGTLALVLLAVCVALPFGLGAGIFLAEYARGKGRHFLIFLVDTLASVPSIVMGLFGFAAILLLRRWLPDANTSLLLAGSCVGLLILPYIIASTRVALESLPLQLRLTSQALGLTRRQAICRVYLPGASKGILGGVILAIGRAAEDVAVILLTGAIASAGLPRSLFDKFEALSFFIMYSATEYRDAAELSRAFAAAGILLLLSAGLFLLATRLQKRIHS